MFSWKFWCGRVSHQPRSWFASKLGQKKLQKRFVVFCGHWSWHVDMTQPGKNDHGLTPLDLALETPMREMLELKGWSVEGGEIEKTSSLFLHKNKQHYARRLFFSQQSNFIKWNVGPSGIESCCHVFLKRTNLGKTLVSVSLESILRRSRTSTSFPFELSGELPRIKCIL